MSTNKYLETNNVKNIVSTATVAIALTLGGSELIQRSQTNNNIYLSNTLTSICSNSKIPVRKNYTNRYKEIGKSEWFRNSYQNKSIGEIVGIDG